MKSKKKLHPDLKAATQDLLEFIILKCGNEYNLQFEVYFLAAFALGASGIAKQAKILSNPLEILDKMFADIRKQVAKEIKMK